MGNLRARSDTWGGFRFLSIEDGLIKALLGLGEHVLCDEGGHQIDVIRLVAPEEIDRLVGFVLQIPDQLFIGHPQNYLKFQVFHRFPVVDDLVQRFDPDLQVHLGKFLGHHPVAFLGFDPLRYHGLVRDQ
jgi:hypothetical protein